MGWPKFNEDNGRIMDERRYMREGFSPESNYNSNVINRSCKTADETFNDYYYSLIEAASSNNFEFKLGLSFA